VRKQVEDTATASDAFFLFMSSQNIYASSLFEQFCLS
jgi:hypothetical protein